MHLDYFEPEDTSGVARGLNPLPPPSGDETPFTKMFEFVGTHDVSGYCSVPAALKFRQDVCGGEERILGYCRQLVREGGALVAERLGTEVLDDEEGNLTRDCLLVNIRLPLTAGAIAMGAEGPLIVVQWGQKATMEYSTFIPWVWHAGAWWARLSAQVYLDISDFERAATVLEAVCRRVQTGEHMK